VTNRTPFWLAKRKKAVSYASLVSSKAKMSELGFWSGWWWWFEWRAVNPPIIREYRRSAFQEGGRYIITSVYLYINAFFVAFLKSIRNDNGAPPQQQHRETWPTFFGNFVCDSKRRRRSTTTTRPRVDGGRRFVAILCRYRIRDNIPWSGLGYLGVRRFPCKMLLLVFCVENTNLMKNLAMWFARKCRRNSQQ